MLTPEATQPSGSSKASARRTPGTPPREADLLRSLDGIVWEVDARTGTPTFIGGQCERILGYPAEKLAEPETWRALVHRDDAAWVGRRRQAELGETGAYTLEYRVLTADGRVLWVHDSARWHDREDGAGFVRGLMVDVTGSHVARERLVMAASVFENASDAILITDADNRIVDANPAFTRISGFTREEVIGQDPKMLKSGREPPSFYAELWETLRADSVWQGEIWNARKDGTHYAAQVSIHLIRDERGEVRHHLAMLSDVTHKKRHEEELFRIAHFDALTGVPNRRLLGDRLEQAIAHANRQGRKVAVCLLDLDGFKQVNDSHGHAAGDRVLVEAVRRLRGVLREEDTLARLGGDEFVVLLRDIDAAGLPTAMKRILAAISLPFSIGDTVAQMSASIGVTIYPDDVGDTDTLLRHADHAMYQAKELGKNRYEVFDARRELMIRSKLGAQQEFERALDAGELVLHFQPKVHLVSGRVSGVEALVRWQHPERGLLPPSQFLPLIAGTPIEERMSWWTLDRALAHLEEWHRSGLPLEVSVNIAGQHLLAPGFAAGLRQRLAGRAVPLARHLQIEMLETSALEDVAAAGRVIRECQALGVRFALDDFGTGYSSLVYLRNLPADVIKIDQTFVRDMLEDAAVQTLVAGVIALSKTYEREVVAEGVETEAHQDLLVSMGCEFGQGFGIARPMPAGEVADRCAAHRLEPMRRAGEWAQAVLRERAATQ